MENAESASKMQSSNTKIGEFFFKYRDYTPIPVVVFMLVLAKPSAFTAALGTLLIISGELLRIYSVGYIGSISRTRKSSTGNELVTTGPYAKVRNPLYLANFFIVLGFLLFANHFTLMVIGIIGFFVQYTYIIDYEETILQDKFKLPYQDYRHSVPKWFPKWQNLTEGLEAPTAVAKAVKSEKRTLTAIALLLLFLSL